MTLAAAARSSGGSIALQTGSFTLVNDALSGSFAIRNSSGGAQQVFVTELAVVNDQAPTAELRPPSAKRTDEDDLMPYELLDAIERAAIRDKQSPSEILLLMEARFVHHTRPQLAVWIERFFRLWCRNQWKREQ